MSESPTNQILIVDDDPSVRATVAMLLADEGYEVSTAEDGFDALLQMKSKVPKLIVSDAFYGKGSDSPPTLLRLVARPASNLSFARHRSYQAVRSRVGPSKRQRLKRHTVYRADVHGVFAVISAERGLGSDCDGDADALHFLPQ